jgi:hypothetical protein
MRQEKREAKARCVVMEMSKVAKCKVSDCAYNENDICHAEAITVGEGRPPRCLTFQLSSAARGGDSQVSSYRFNVDSQCQVPEIFVG